MVITHNPVTGHELKVSYELPLAELGHKRAQASAAFYLEKYKETNRLRKEAEDELRALKAQRKVFGAEGVSNLRSAKHYLNTLKKINVEKEKLEQLTDSQ
jgi:hypothetical protein